MPVNKGQVLFVHEIQYPIVTEMFLNEFKCCEPYGIFPTATS
jgi:hypothetical protein